MRRVCPEQRQEAQGLVEYALVLALVSLAAALALTAFGGGVGLSLSAAVSSLASTMASP